MAEFREEELFGSALGTQNIYTPLTEQQLLPLSLEELQILHINRYQAIRNYLIMRFKTILVEYPLHGAESFEKHKISMTHQHLDFSGKFTVWHDGAVMFDSQKEFAISGEWLRDVDAIYLEVQTIQYQRQQMENAVTKHQLINKILGIEKPH